MNRSLLLPLILLFGILCIWWFTCRFMSDRFDCFFCPGTTISQVKATPSQPAATATVPTETAPVVPLTIKDGAKVFMERSNANFRFPVSGDNPEMVAELKSKLPEIAAYLKNNPGKKLNLTGYYGSKETNTTSFPNLGLGRADNIKQRLLGFGANGSQITTKAQLNDNLPTYINKVYGGIDFAFSGQNRKPVEAIAKVEPKEVEPKAAEPKEVEPKKNEPVKITEEKAKDLLFKPRNLYFKSGKSELELTPVLEQYFVDMKNYLNQAKDKKVHLTGHTDNSGAEDANARLGKKRAEQVKQIIIKRGIAANRITTSSLGETKPIDTNDTDKGKRRNRRVEMIAK